jgi:CspA family cold shock protein
MDSGTVKKLVAGRGFGFIEGPHGDVFFHQSNVENGVFETLREGQAVSYFAVEGKDGGRARAVHVTLGLAATQWPECDTWNTSKIALEVGSASGTMPSAAAADKMLNGDHGPSGIEDGGL